ncbi:(2Fe-2S)-binding protein [Paenibacillus sp. ACRSA]|uniref:(2Fe-2S)-binding protein n=1 Tax=Paenibacillus sp. ACRSA TaxID=2918211 RepID=UPI001EF52C1A|nr:(2Fe-2S)-binding protein [Paenibacillus sp. ACRSA]MCG7377178.1 (2Fe-2S)-binding protein [Paenibacillus sp. ACRSA]
MGRYPGLDPDSDPKHSELVETLQHFFVTTIRSSWETSEYSFTVKDLLNGKQRRSFLREQALQQGLELEGTGSVAVGTLFAKRYSVWVMAIISAFSLYDTLLSIEDNVVSLKLTGTGSMRYESQLEQVTVAYADITKRRSQLSMLKGRLQLHLETIFKGVAADTGASEKVMWALIAHNVQQLYAQMIYDEGIWKTAERLTRIQEDRSVWLAPQGDTESPFASKLKCFEHPKWQGQPLLIRRYCCLAYQVGSGSHAHGYCNSCPKLDSESRLRNLLQK